MNNELILEHALPPHFDHLPRFKRWLLKGLAKIKKGKLYIHVDDECYACGEDDSLIAHIHIHEPYKMAWRVLSKGDIGFAESYLDNFWSSDDPTTLLKLLLKNRGEIAKNITGMSLLRTGINAYHRMRKNSLKGSRKNIEYHYDLGNDFYELWLDESMSYSSALFVEDNEKSERKWGGVSNTHKKHYSTAESLVSAQQAKYQRILDELDAKPHQAILEIGCGWGGFAEKALENGNTVHGITLSHEQLAYANKRLEKYGDQAKLEIKDYRFIENQYDHIVSIEMFEAVGLEYWQSYFEILKRSLKPGGKIVLQIITIKDEYFEEYRNRADFIQRYIFPGGMLPSEEKLLNLAEKNNLDVCKKINFGLDYGETLARWEKRFLEATPELEKLGYDQRFQLMWRYYLAYCQAGFEEQRIDVVQLTLEHSTSV